MDDDVKELRLGAQHGETHYNELNGVSWQEDQTKTVKPAASSPLSLTLTDGERASKK